MTSKIEKELQDATSVKPKSKEKRADYLDRLADEADKLPEKAWDNLSDAAKEWVNDANEATEKAKERGGEAKIKDFDDAGDDASESDSKEKTKETKKSKDDSASDSKKDDTDVASKKDKAKSEKKAKTDKPAKAAKAPKEKKARGSGKMQALMSVIIKNPKSTAAELHEKMKAKGSEISQSTVSTVRSDFIRSVNFLDEQGLLKSNPFAGD